jgi:tripartite-type tricarboxylate transporter receptor subunit TctC
MDWLIRRRARRWIGAALTGVAALGWTQAQGQNAYPARPVQWVVPFTAGGITDNTSRLLARKLGEQLGASVVVENRPGAGGTLGAEMVAHAAPDGYTLLYGTQGTHAANAALYKNLRYDPVKDFIPVHGLFQTSTILVVNASRPYKTVQELVAYAHAHPGKVNFASAGPGTGTHLTAELFQAATGIKMTHVPYKGSGPAINDLIAGNVDIMFDYPVSTIAHIEAGKLRPLAVTSKSRLPMLPNVPSIAEAGVPEAESVSWSGIYVPARTPQAVVTQLANALEKLLKDPDVLASNGKFGSVPMVGLREAKFGAYQEAEIVKWRTVVQRSGARLD